MTGSVATAQPAWRAGPARASLATIAADTGAGPEAAPLLTVSGLSVSYGRLRALEDINLSEEPDVILAQAVDIMADGVAAKATNQQQASIVSR